MNAKPLPASNAASAQSFRFVSDRWPARTCQLMEGLHQLASDWLRAPLQRTLDHCAGELLASAECARNGNDLQDCMASRETLLAERSMVEQRFIRGVGRALNRIGEPPARAQASTLQQPLSLVNPAEQDRSAAMEKVAARGVASGGTPLFELGYRLAVLVGSPPLEDAANPLGPHALVTAFGDATAALRIPDEHQLKLLASFDHTLIHTMASLYEAANRHLLADGILPRLRAYAFAPTPGDTGDGGDGHADGERQASPGRASGARSRNRASGTMDASTSEPIAVLEGLRELLAQRRGARSNALPGGAGNGSQIASSQELQAALGALQQRFAEITEHASRELRSAQRLREELLAQINAGQPAGAPPARLSAEHDSTIELVAMLFEQLARQAQAGGNTRAVLGGLELPMLRMAVSDRGFFERSEHPARRLLNTVTEASNDWLDTSGGKPDQGLVAKLEHLIERASREPPSAGLYASLLADIEQHLNLLKLRASATERHHVEAMRAQERLNQARLRAAELMAARFAKTKPAPRGLLRALLDRAWTDVLALTLLRHGEHDATCQDQLAITDQLLGLAPVADRRRLQRDVQMGLRQIGMARDEAIQVAERLVAPDKPASPANDAPSTTELLVRLKQHQRLGQRHSTRADKTAVAAKSTDDNNRVGDPGTGSTGPISIEPPPRQAGRQPAVEPAHPTSRTVDNGPPAPVQAAAKIPDREALARMTAVDTVEPCDKSLRERLGKLPFGTWFDFTDPMNGRVIQRKLAWYSPISGQALFVTRRGQRTGSMSLGELATRIQAGHVRKSRDTRDSMLDRAWHNLASTLRRGGTAASTQRATP